MLLTMGRVRNVVVVGGGGGGGGGRAGDVFTGVLGPVGDMMLSIGELFNGLWMCGSENGVCGVWNGEDKEREVELDWIEPPPPDVDWV